jgi:proteic killer suppression protein
VAIVSFRCAETERVFSGLATKRFAAIRTVLTRKLTMLDIAKSLEDLRVPPGNRLEPLRGDRTGEHSIRVNDQFRLCFEWTPHGPARVHCVDYH